MSRLKRVLSVKVADTGQAIEIMRALGELEANIVAESRPGIVKIRIYGSKEEVRDLTRKILVIANTGKKS
jgi:hypothetical protein